MEIANDHRRLHLWSSNVNTAAHTILPPSPRAHDLYPYSSKEDVVDAVIASSYVPCIAKSNVAMLYRGRAWIDAAAATSLDYVCDSLAAPTGGECVQVVAMQVGPGSPNASTVACPPESKATTPRTGPLYPEAPVSQWALPLNCSVYQAFPGDFWLAYPEIKAGTICPGWCVFFSFHFLSPLFSLLLSPTQPPPPPSRPRSHLAPYTSSTNPAAPRFRTTSASGAASASSPS